MANYFAVSLNPLSASLPSGSTPYIRVLMIFSSSIFFCLNLSAKYNAADSNLFVLTEMCCTISLCLCENQFYVLTNISQFPPVCSYCSFTWPIYHLNLFQGCLLGSMKDNATCRTDRISIPGSSPWHKVLHIASFQHLLLFWCYVFHKFHKSYLL